MAKAKVAQMTRIIEDVLDLCGARRGNIPLVVERVDLAKIVAAAIQTVRPIVMAKSHHLSIVLPPSPVILDAHPSRLEQAITNLLTNAANYTHPCGRIRLTVDLAPGTVILRVRDNGIGIAPDLLPHIFDPYRRGSTTQHCYGGGLGIGLALVKCLVELHGGTVAAYSDGLATGSEFVVSLPAAIQT
jgi:signal transduction histidine kinase